jgi:glycosyltransferase involved in cell wall biosynthesis
MKALFIINTRQTDALGYQFINNHLIHCRSVGIETMVIELMNGEIVHSVPTKNFTSELFVFDDSQFAEAQVAFHNLVFLLQGKQFVPDVIEFFNEYFLLHFASQYKLLNTSPDLKASMILNITSGNLPHRFTKNPPFSIQQYFYESLLKSILLCADKVYYHSTGIREQLYKVPGMNPIKPEQFELKTAPERKDDFFSKLPEHKTLYPFGSLEGESVPLREELPLVSVVIPYYNMGAFIVETVQSVLNSSYSNIEILIVNDGSNEAASISELNQVKKISEKIKIIDQPNSGVAEARNNGIRNASGSVIALLDADDLVEQTYYEKAVCILKNFNNVSFVGCWTQLFDETGRTERWITHNPDLPLFFLMNTINSQAIVVRKDALLQHGMHDSTLNMVLDDWESVINMMMHNLRGVVIPEFLFRYRIRRNSVFRSHHNRWTDSYSKIIQKHEAIINRYGKELLLLLINNGPNLFYKNPEEATDYYRLLHELPNFRIRNSSLNKWLSQYYDFVEMNPLGIKIRRAIMGANKKIKRKP